MKILNWLTDVTMTLICYEKLDTCEAAQHEFVNANIFHRTSFIITCVIEEQYYHGIYLIYISMRKEEICVFVYTRNCCLYK